MWFMPIADHGNPHLRNNPAIRGSQSFCSSLENVRMLETGSQPVSRTHSHRETPIGMTNPRVHDYISPSRESLTRHSSSNVSDSRNQELIRHGSKGLTPSGAGGGPPILLTPTGSTHSGRHDSEKRLLRQSQASRSSHREDALRAPTKDPASGSSDSEQAVARLPATEPGESRRRKIVFLIVLFSASLLLMSILLMVITVQWTPGIDEKLRKEQEEMMRKTNQGYVFNPNATEQLGDLFTTTTTSAPTSPLTTTSAVAAAAATSNAGSSSSSSTVTPEG